MEENTTIGQLLKEARIKKNMSIDDIINKTKININVLKHLEDDALSELPSRPYVKGFVANYAKAVGLNSELAKETLEYSYRLQNNANTSLKNEVLPNNSPEHAAEEVKTSSNVNHNTEELRDTLTSIAKSLFNKKIFYSVIAVALIIGISKSIQSFFNQLTSESESITSHTSEVAPKDKEIVAGTEAENQPMLKEANEDLFDFKATKKLEAVVEESTPLVDTLIDKLNKNLTEKESTKPALKVEKVEREITEVKPKVDIEKKIENKATNLLADSGKFPFKEFYPSPTNMYDLVADAPEVNDTNILPSYIKASAVADKQNVYIVATEDNTWISYKVDDEKIKRYILKKGRSVLIKGDQILLFMGNFNATKVFLNNKLVTADTKTGVKSMIFPEDKAKDFELPLFPSVNGVPYSAKEYKANMNPKSDTSLE